MYFIGIIPARYASTRFPGKPLADIKGKSMIQRVYEQSKKASILSELYVATDDVRIEEHVKSFGGNVVMTPAECRNGTERCFEALKKINKKKEDVVVINIQGDEPFIHPEQIEKVASLFKNKHVGIATLIKKISTTEELTNSNIVKVVVNKDKEAIYFSRFPIPFYRDKKNDDALKLHDYYKHIGMYAYREDILAKLISLKQTPCETAESLEQLRWIENAFSIQTEITEFESIAVDTKEDLLTFD